MADFHVHIPYHKIAEHLSFIRQEKLNLELYIESNALDLISREDISQLKNQLDYNPSLTIHAPFMDLSPGAVDSKVRAVTMERFFHVMNIAGDLKVKAVVFHSGYEKWKYALNIGLWLEQSLLTWKPLVKKAEEISVKIAIENIFEDEPQNLRLLMEKMGNDSFGICFDSGHFNLFSKVSLEDWLGHLKPYIIELHLHDNNKTSDQHLPVGEGTFDFGKLFSAMKGKDLIYTLEAHNPEDAKKSIEQLKKFFSV
ncbi:MAG: sugar phosphate isomerase/epimerase [Nitrospinae bacterium]|nr:sugar phosphate isomerase/epimerase [Nitrospinota bacterium]MCG2813886.1 sugar phosphate isomerase/epimerase [Thermodesulfovibrionales bacterium]